MKHPELSASAMIFASPSSYTIFAYSDITAEVNGTNAALSVRVTNIGGRAGAETVLLFLRCHTSRITPFVRRLRGFDKVFLKTGESTVVNFTRQVTENILL